VYYYPSHRELSQTKRSSVWKCKIGKTDIDPYDRMRQQVDKKTGMPEEPRMGLIIKTDDHVNMEKAIQSLLEVLGRKCEESPGKEWYITSPSEVERIYIKNFSDKEVVIKGHAPEDSHTE